ncbi:MAG: N-6 DNA methylase [Bacteroidales bacterium]|nr:N-6 DNA methylase [Bacteroidales bacterium]
MEPQIKALVESVGLLNVPLRHNQQTGVPLYALLNGSTNNVCAGVNTECTVIDFQQMAWSSGCNYFLHFMRNRCNVIRFDTTRVESYEETTIVQNADKFFNHIARSKRNEENQIVPFVLRAYRKLRNELRREKGIDSLRGLLYLLASLCNQEQVLDLSRWGLSDIDHEIALSIGEGRWNMISEELKNGLFLNGSTLIPNLELTLRHTAGKLFEEANYIAYLPDQLNLFPDERIRYQYKTNEDGAYFTPSYVARSIVEEALLRFNAKGNDCITMFDPACGAGGFLVEALRQLKATGYQGRVRVYAWDKAETAIAISKFVLNFEKREWGDNKMELKVEHQDSLSPDAVWPNDVDILLMNPPFLSWDMMDDQLRAKVTKITGETGKMNLAAAFLVKACEAIKENGVLGAVLPNSIINDASYKGLRSRLLDEMNLQLVGGLGSFVFETVLAYTSMIVARKQRNREDCDTTFLWTNNVVGAAEEALRALRKSHVSSAIVDADNYSIHKGMIGVGLQSWKPERTRSIIERDKLERKLGQGLFSTIGKLFDIIQGVRTGANRIFIIDQSLYNSFPSEEKKYFRPSVDNLAVQNGKLSVVNYVFYPYTTGLDPIASEEDLAAKVPMYYNRILKPHQNQLSERLSITNRNRWWELTRNRPWQAECKPKLVSTEFGKSGSFAIDYNGDFVIERGFAWKLKEIDDLQFKKYAEAYLAIFNSEYMNQLLSMYADQLAGGDIYRLGLASVKAIPIPDLKQEEFSKYITTLRAFSKMMADGEYWDEDELDECVKNIMRING